MAATITRDSSSSSSSFKRSTVCAEKIITNDQLSRYRNDFDKDPSGSCAQNVLQFTGIHEVCLRQSLIQERGTFTFSHEINNPGMQATDQKSSGRCWLFAALNLVRMDASKTLNVTNLEFSESYHLFYDKLEKANAFLENMITHPQFLAGDITVNFIQNHDELFQFKKRKNRATKILKFLANVTVNGNSDVRFIDPNKTFDKPIIPDYDRFAKPKDGTKQLLEKLGPEKFSQWLKEQKNVQITVFL